jgi:DNA-binding NarL/FixJ family response regulator
VGGVLARRLGLPNRVARLIERHHTDPEDGDTAVLRLANTLAHYSAGDPVSQTELIAIAESAGVAGARLDDLLYELPTAGAESRRVDPSPLTARQTSIVRLLAHGKLYKQIAAELELSPSTVRSHLHAVYTKLGVADRTQAVLLAMERGWLS